MAIFRSYIGVIILGCMGDRVKIVENEIPEIMETWNGK